MRNVRGSGSRQPDQGSKWIRPEKRRQLYARDACRCQFCGAPVVPGPGGDATLDHLLAVELGGGNEPTNLVTACKACNGAKRDMSRRAFFARLRSCGVDVERVRSNLRNATRRALPPRDVADGMCETVRAAALACGRLAA